MLLRLAVKDVVLIETLELVLQPGLTVFTGETGAGKSIVLDALELALGSRGDPGLIRQGCNQASIMAEFMRVPPQVAVLLEESGIPPQDTLILRRVLQRTGPSRAYINDVPVSVGLLKSLGEWLLEVHGQFDRLLAPSLHAQALDAFARIDTTAVRDAYRRWQALEDAHSQLSLTQDAQAQNRVLLTAQVTEIAALNPQPGEEEELLSLRQRMAHGKRVEEALSQAADLLTDTQQGALQALYGAENALKRAQDLLGNPGAQALAALARSVIEINEATSLMTQMQRDSRYEPHQLQAVDDRLQALRVVARKYVVTSDALVELLQTSQLALQQIADDADGVEVLAQQKQQAKQEYVRTTDALRDKRVQARGVLVARMQAELPALKLERAQLWVEIKPLPESQWGEHGTDSVAFQVATNPGQEPGALSKVASGGELARLMLALKVVLAAKNDIQAIVFDEIDQGVSGPVAAAIGERLRQLSQNCQVLVITHSPQVAAVTNQHFLVQKSLAAGAMLTHVSALSEIERQEELARMLSGQEITQEARAAAARLQESGLSSQE